MTLVMFRFTSMSFIGDRPWANTSGSSENALQKPVWRQLSMATIADLVLPSVQPDCELLKAAVLHPIVSWMNRGCSSRLGMQHNQPRNELDWYGTLCRQLQCVHQLTQEVVDKDLARDTKQPTLAVHILASVSCVRAVPLTAP